MHSLTLQQDEATMSSIPPNNEDLLAAFQTLASDLGVASLSELLRGVLDRQQANYDLFCTVNGLNEEISAAKAAVEAADQEVKVCVCFFRCGIS
jgi:hypothetical protein